MDTLKSLLARLSGRAPVTLELGQDLYRADLTRELKDARSALDALGVPLPGGWVVRRLDPLLAAHEGRILFGETEVGRLCASGELAEALRARAWQLLGLREVESLVRRAQRSGHLPPLARLKVELTEIWTEMRRRLRAGESVRAVRSVVETLAETRLNERVSQVLRKQQEHRRQFLSVMFDSALRSGRTPQEAAEVVESLRPYYPKHFREMK